MVTAPVSIIVVTGVTGSGKTTVGRALAERLAWRFYDADDLHDPENIERMRRGIPLTDALRQPWLSRVRETIEQTLEERRAAVIACSALKHSYRHALAGGLEGVRFVLLTAPAPLLRQRLTERRDHFAGPALLESQLAALEYPSEALVVDSSAPVVEVVNQICAGFGFS